MSTLKTFKVDNKSTSYPCHGHVIAVVATKLRQGRKLTQTVYIQDTYTQDSPALGEGFNTCFTWQIRISNITRCLHVEDGFIVIPDFSAPAKTRSRLPRWSFIYYLVCRSFTKPQMQRYVGESKHVGRDGHFHNSIGVSRAD